MSEMNGIIIRSLEDKKSCTPQEVGHQLLNESFKGQSNWRWRWQNLYVVEISQFQLQQSVLDKPLGCVIPKWRQKLLQTSNKWGKY